MTTYRKHGRTLLNGAVTLEHEKLGEVTAEIRDVSETGIFVNCRDWVNKISVGDAFLAKLDACQEVVRNIPKELTVVRLTEEGVAFSYE